MDWLGLSSLAVAIATLALVVRQELRQQRHEPHADLSIAHLGDARDGDTGEPVGHVWELINDGSADVRIHAVHGSNCKVKYSEAYPPLRAVKGVSSARLMVDPCDVSRAWVIVIWTAPTDPRGYFVQWFAPLPGQELAAAQMTAPPDVPAWIRRLRPLWLRWRLYRPRAVGPGGVSGAYVRGGTRRTGVHLLAALAIAAPGLVQEELDQLI